MSSTLNVIILTVGVVLTTAWLVALFGMTALRWWTPWQRVACWIGWHSYPTFDPTGHDGCSTHAKCKWCHGEGMIDGQGNLFAVEEVSDHE